MEQEAADELAGVERHGFVAGAAFLAIVLPAEGYASLIKGEQALVGNRDANW